MNPCTNKPSSKKTILVVDDDLQLRLSLQDILETEGYNVLMAENGKAALEFMRRDDKPRLILLDLLMPIMGGEEFLRQARSEALLGDTSVVVVSASCDEHAIDGVDGIDGVLAKPVDLGNLLDAVSQHI